MTKAIELKPGKLTLDELKLVEQGWYQEALKAGYPEIVWTILDQLGKEITIGSRGNIKVWRVRNIMVFGYEDGDKYDPISGSWKIVRHYSVVFADKILESAPLNDATDFNKFILNSELVMRWSWHYFESDKDKLYENTDSCLFVNGDWILSVRNFLAEAQTKKDSTLLSETEQERRRLENKLLIGKGI